MSVVLKIIAVLVGTFLIWQVSHAMKEKKMSEGQSVFWLLGAVIIIILGVFPRILTWIGNLLGVWWKPALLLFCIVVILAFIAFGHAKELSVLRSEVTELAMQMTLLKDENAQLKQALTRTDEDMPSAQPSQKAAGNVPPDPTRETADGQAEKEPR